MEKADLQTALLWSAPLAYSYETLLAHVTHLEFILLGQLDQRFVKFSRQVVTITGATGTYIASHRLVHDSMTHASITVMPDYCTHCAKVA